MQRVEATGSLEPEPSGGRKPLLLEPYAETLASMVEVDHDITLVKIQAELHHRFDVVAGLSTLHRMLRQPKSLSLGLRLKKVVESGGANWPDVVTKRYRWRVWQRFMDPGVWLTVCGG